MDKPFHYLSMANHMMIQKHLMEQLKDSGLTLGQPKILDYLKVYDGASQKDIAAACHIEAGSLTSVLNRMEDKGMIERRTLNGNRRTYYIFLTESGREFQKMVEEGFDEIEKEAWDGISIEERNAFMQTFLKINENLSKTDRRFKS